MTTKPKIFSRHKELEDLLRRASLFDRDNPNDCLELANNALAIASELNNSEGKKEALIIMSKINQILGLNTQAFKYGNEVFQMAKEESDFQTMVKCCLVLGNVYDELGDSEKVLTYLFDALKLNVREYNGRLLNNISLQYRKLGEWEKAMEFLKRSIAQKKKFKDDRTLDSSYINMGNLYIDKKEYLLAREEYQKGLSQAQANGRNWQICISLRNLGDTYKETGQFEMALDYYQRAITIAEKYSFTYHILAINAVKSQIFQEQGNLQKAIKLNQITLAEAEEYKFEMIIKWCLERLEEAYEQLGDYRLAYQYLKKREAYNRDLGDKQKMDKINTLMEDKEFEIKILKEKNDRIEHQNQLLALSNSELKQYAYIVAHDLKEPLRNIVSFIGLIKRKWKLEETPEAAEFMGFVSRNAQLMYLQLESLLRYATLERSQGDLSLVDTKAAVEEVLQSLGLDIKSDEIQIEVGNLPSVYFNKTLFSQIIQNLLQNAVKFKRTDPVMISIKGCEQDGFCKYSVRDNGIGIKSDYFDSIFKIFNQLDRKNFNGTGIGLAICKKIVNLHGGEIWVESELNSGSTFYFTLPGNVFPYEEVS